MKIIIKVLIFVTNTIMNNFFRIYFNSKNVFSLAVQKYNNQEYQGDKH